jgi:ubiquitin carboxyl-terminal hydrolase 5/13
MSCSHIAGLSLKEPSYSQPVYKEECTLCFDSQDGPKGIDVCLTCYNGACPRSHAALHHSKTGHALALNVQRTRKQRADTEPPLKKLAIRSEPSEAELYDVHTRVKCYECARDLSAEEASKV